MRVMHIAVVGIAVTVGVVKLSAAAEGLTDERLAQIADTVFARFDSDKSGALAQGELTSAKLALYGQVESLARRALGDTRVKASDLLGDAAPQATLDGAGEMSADAFREYVAATYRTADRQVRTIYERRASEFEQYRRETRSREYERYGDGPLQRGPYGAGDEWGWQREREFAREREARRRAETGQRPEGQRGNEEQRRREAAQMEEQRRQMERARETQQRQLQEARARVQQQQARPPQVPQRSPFGRPQPGGATFQDRLRGKK